MQPPTPQPGPTVPPEQVPAPGPVIGLAVVLWISAAISLTVLAFNMATAAVAGVEPGYAFGYSLPHAVVGVLLAAPAVAVTRGRPWARGMAKAVLIIQIVFQSMALISGNGLLWALMLLPLAITGVVLLNRPLSKWFFTVHGQPVGQAHAGQYAAYDPYRQAGQGNYPDQQHPPQQYPPQAYEQQPQPPHNGSWGQGPHQR